MTDAEKAASEYSRGKPDATFQDAREFAADRYSDLGEQAAFLTAWREQSTNAREFAADMERIWPKEKGY